MWVAVPPWAVTTTLMVFAPTAKAMLPDAVPDVTIAPFTVIVASEFCAVGVTVTDAVALTTDVVYVVVPPLVPVLVNVDAGVSINMLSKAFADAVLAMTIE